MTDKLIAECLATNYEGYYWNPKERVLYSARKGNHIQAVDLQLACDARGVPERYVVHADHGAVGVPRDKLVALDDEFIARKQVAYKGFPTVGQLRARRVRAAELRAGDKIVCVDGSNQSLRYGATYIVDSAGITSGVAWASIHNAANVVAPIKISLELRDDFETARYFVMSEQKETNVHNLFDFLVANREAASKDLSDNTGRPAEAATRYSIGREEASDNFHGRPRRTASQTVSGFHEIDELDDSDAYR